jgi:hypothetical protein
MSMKTNMNNMSPRRTLLALISGPAGALPEEAIGSELPPGMKKNPQKTGQKKVSVQGRDGGQLMDEKQRTGSVRHSTGNRLCS